MKKTFQKKELRQKVEGLMIRGLKYIDGTSNDKEFFTSYGYNNAIEDVLKLIKSL